MLLLSLLTLTGCSWFNRKTKPLIVISRVYILEKQDDSQFKIISSSNSDKPLEDEISSSPNKLIALTQSKFKQLKDKILKLSEENKKLKNE